MVQEKAAMVGNISHIHLSKVTSEKLVFTELVVE